MATRATIREHLRRRLQEVVPAKWSDAALNVYINQAYQYTQGVVQMVEPLAFGHYEDAIETVQNQRLYPLPVNNLTPIRLQIRETTDGAYKDIGFVWFEDSLPPVDFSTTQRDVPGRVWGLQGTYLFLDPPWGKPNIAEGLRLTYVPALVMGSDSDVPETPQNTHFMIVLLAHLCALADTARHSDERKAVAAEVALEVRHFLSHWNRQLPAHGQPPNFRVSPRAKLGHLYGGDWNPDLPVKTT